MRGNRLTRVCLFAGYSVLFHLTLDFSTNLPLPCSDSMNIFSSYESPLDNNTSYTPHIEMQNLMGSIYDSFFDYVDAKRRYSASCVALARTLCRYISFALKNDESHECGRIPNA